MAMSCPVHRGLSGSDHVKPYIYAEDFEFHLGNSHFRWEAMGGGFSFFHPPDGLNRAVKQSGLTKNTVAAGSKSPWMQRPVSANGPGER